MSASVPEVHALLAQLLELLGLRLTTGSITFHLADGHFLKYQIETYGRPPRRPSSVPDETGD